MNWRGDRHGHFGVRVRTGCKSRPYYGRVSFQGKHFDTRSYATVTWMAGANTVMLLAILLLL